MASADECAHSRLEFLYFEGLNQVIIGPEFKTLQFVLERVPGGEHQHRGGFSHFLP